MTEISKLSPGLYIVAVPIGNVNDITIRALETLKLVDVIACEDTRVTDRLLKAHHIHASMTCYNDYSTERDRHHILGLIEQGKSVALVSDAGTPLISDPGYKLIGEAVDKHISIVSLPGPSAVITALTLAGLPTHRFSFEGFLPPKEQARKNALKHVSRYDGSLVYYESPRRLIDTLKDMAEILGNRHATVLRELTKPYEEIQRSTLPSLYQLYAKRGEPKGEIVIVVGPPEPLPKELAEQVSVNLSDLAKELLQNNRLKDSVQALIKLTGLPKNDLYELALLLKNGDSDEQKE